ncbi:DUF4387 family protein [Variovorax saccharolyticus]|uniref:DUF4387 family protein n=1 Tax=Variovorax saccharolyticus TaxID=3053516 RepID=UPI0025758EA3|nr:DUF4387 family protein [Variovorax sp. J22R187]MDM0018779.1 DUF4387 family protein [Variovorax sp. J22R187]
MAKLVYRVVSACGALGYGFPRESLQKALEGRIDAIISDAGSMDAGPYYLGTGNEYFEREAVKADYRHMVEAGLQTGSPVILGSCGMAGGRRNLDWMLEVAKEVFAELGVKDAKVAVIHSDLDPGVVVDELRKGALLATGAGPELDEAALRESVIVGQMGIHPLITALESGARYIFAGRACDIALFASDMIRRGIDPGIAYHVGHVLECGALACDPGTPSDCLVAEVFDDGSAVFVAPDPNRRCTPYSIAAHSLYEESHPQLQFYPEGILVMDKTEFFAPDARSTGIRNSRFVRAGKPWPWSIKLEGSRRLGARKVSLIHIAAADLPKIPAELLVYGRNGVQARAVEGDERELGIIVETRAKTPEAAETLASLLTHYLIHYGYPGRKATAGNIAYPLSPNLVSFRREDGLYGAIVPSGTRDPVFFANYEKIKSAVIGLIEAQFPEALAQADYQLIDADAEHPAVLLRTIDSDPDRLAARHAAEVDAITRLAPPQPGSHLNLDAADAYAWSLYHLLQNEEVIKKLMFPISYYRAEGDQWVKEGEERPRYFDIGITGYDGNLDDRTLSLIADAPPRGEPHGSRRLLDMAVVIRSKDAGINRLTFDIVFNSAADYEAALRSNLFHKESVAKILHVDAERVVGSFFVDSCNAIKISIDRPNISASADERDVFGAQQQSKIEGLGIPVHAHPLSSASAL